jgi:hypothetical protein
MTPPSSPMPMACQTAGATCLPCALRAITLMTPSLLLPLSQPLLLALAVPSQTVIGSTLLLMYVCVCVCVCVCVLRRDRDWFNVTRFNPCSCVCVCAFARARGACEHAQPIARKRCSTHTKQHQRTPAAGTFLYNSILLTDAPKRGAHLCSSYSAV